MKYACIFLLAALLAACGGPRKPITSRTEALNDQRQLNVRVVKVYDCMLLNFPTESSHLIEVELVDLHEGDGRLTLPYDEWMMGAPPPKKGERLTITPSAWLRGDGKSKGKPMHGWKERKPDSFLR
jgi:hypothetical protein